MRIAVWARALIGVLAMGSCVSGGQAEATVAAGSLSLLTYNVEGLPWPVRLGRGEKLRQIGDTLAALRAQGRQPHVVVLQEAFTPEAKAIAARAGYRYVADGPAAAEAGVDGETSADRSFASGASLLRGEAAGKWLDSGLRIASDYPIVAVRRMAYPAYACAGFDCLANKGVLAVSIRVPGMADPVAIVATHLNSRRASHAPADRALYAYQRQVDALSAFVRRVVPSRYPFVLVGDLNVGRRVERRSYLIRNAAGWRGAQPPAVAMEQCLPDPTCNKANLPDLRYSFHRARDWQFYSDGRATGLRVAGITGLFGHDGQGAMLSDHVGYVASYRLVLRRPDAPLMVASR